MKRFVVPPDWPSPPRRSWIPPRTWQPDPAWPPAPEGWRFWVDGKGDPVRGPIGRYGGPSGRLVYGGAAAAVAFLVVNVWALFSIGLFGGDGPTRQAGSIQDDASPVPSVVTTPTPSAKPSRPVVPPRTTATPVPTKTRSTTERTTREPEPTRTSRRPRRTEQPTPDRTTTTRTTRPPSTRPPRSTTTRRTPTREEILAEYCRQRGWPVEWCDPDNWSSDPNNR